VETDRHIKSIPEIFAVAVNGKYGGFEENENNTSSNQRASDTDLQLYLNETRYHILASRDIVTNWKNCRQHSTETR